MSFSQKLFANLQYLLPQHGISRAVHYLAECETPWIKDAFTKWFVDQYDINMSEALEEDPTKYKHFNDFFTRSLKPGIRPIAEGEKAIVSPADGAISQHGPIKHGRVVQAKGQDYSVTELLGGDYELAKTFMGGSFMTIYLSPSDYHRVHMPNEGTLRSMTFVPGKLFSVNNATAQNVPRLFARNERVVSVFDTPNGPMVSILVGAMIVASIETTWAGLVAPVRREIKTTQYTDIDTNPIQFEKGQEMGRFKLGSTVILLYPKDAMNWAEGLNSGDVLRLGQEIGQYQ